MADVWILLQHLRTEQKQFFGLLWTKKKPRITWAENWLQGCKREVV